MTIEITDEMVRETIKRAVQKWNESVGPDEPTLTPSDIFSEDVRDHLTAALPIIEKQMRAAWEQPIRELHRPVHAVFSWADGPRYEEPCETCHGAPGVHECGCWADTQIEYVCAECHRLGSGSKGVYDYTWPCPTIALLEGGGE